MRRVVCAVARSTSRAFAARRAINNSFRSASFSRRTAFRSAGERVHLCCVVRCTTPNFCARAALFGLHTRALLLRFRFSLSLRCVSSSFLLRCCGASCLSQHVSAAQRPQVSRLRQRDRRSRPRNVRPVALLCIGVHQVLGVQKSMPRQRQT